MPTTPVPGKVGPCPLGAAAEWAGGCVDCHVWGPPFHLFCQGEGSHYLSWPGAPPLVSYLQLLELKKKYPFLERKKKSVFQIQSLYFRRKEAQTTVKACGGLGR